MAEAAPAAAGGGIGDILATAERDFLVRNSGEQVSQPPLHSSLICLEAGYIDAQIRHLALLARLRLFLSCGFRLDTRSDFFFLKRCG